MPYTADHKQQTRVRIVECARELFNLRGFSDVTIDEIMGRAGLTRGGFYNHFGTKEELFVEAIASYLNFDPAQRWKDVNFDATLCGEAFARQMVNTYLSRTHLRDREGHCPMIALASDASRAGARVRSAFRKLVEHMAGILGNGVRAADAAERQSRGLAIAALCVGGMVLARTIDDDALGDKIREAAHTIALELVG